MSIFVNVSMVGGACDFNDPAPAAQRVVRLVSTTNITPISGIQTVDTVATVDADRVLLVGQTTQSENGIYVVSNSGAWTRATDWNDGSQMSAGTAIYATNGIILKYSNWILTNLGAIIIGTTSLVFKPNGANFDPNPGISIATGAQIGVGELRIHNAGTTNTILSLRPFSEVGLLQPINSGAWIGGAAGYHGLSDTTGWIAFAGAQGKMTGVPLNVDISGAFPGYWAPIPDLTNFKLYAWDAQPGGSWKCYGEAYTARKRGANLTDANQTLQPFTDKASQYNRVIPLTANRNTTLGVTSVVTGTKVTIVRQDNAAFTNAIINGGGGAGTLFTFAASPTEPQRFSARFDGTNWIAGDFEYVEA